MSEIYQQFKCQLKHSDVPIAVGEPCRSITPRQERKNAKIDAALESGFTAQLQKSMNVTLKLTSGGTVKLVSADGTVSPQGLHYYNKLGIEPPSIFPYEQGLESGKWIRPFVGEKKIQIESVFYIFYGTQHRVNTIKQHFQSCVWNKYGTHIQLGSFTLKLKLTYNDGERLTVLLDHMTMLDDVKEFLARSVVEAVQQEPEWHTVDTLTVVESLEDATLC